MAAEPLAGLGRAADHSWLEQLTADPETEKYVPNKRSRQVFSGHYVRVAPTPLPKPSLVIHSGPMARDLGISDEEVNSEAFAAFFSGEQSRVPALQSWCTPYALSIMGERMTSNCPFGNGNGYGDGRAASIGEVVVEGKRWELQLKGAGQTPFCRGADGRAVLRSSIREFLASEAMFHLGVDTTRALSLVLSGSETTKRPWYSEGNNSGDPDKMIEESCAITCRVAPSFLRVGHVDLFARRAGRGNSTEQQQRELALIVKHALFREYPDVLPGGDLPDRAEAMLSHAAERFGKLVSGWLRVGFCQGNFNADNCLVAGRTMDYGPFGWMDKYDPLFAKWVGSGQHFAFLNQPEAAIANYFILFQSVAPVLTKNPKEAQVLFEVGAKVIQREAADTWRQKMGFATKGHAAAAGLWEELEPMMRRGEVDYTIFWRQLAIVAEIPSAVAEAEGDEEHLVEGRRVRARGLVLKPDMNGKQGTLLKFDTERERWQVRMDGDDSVSLLHSQNLGPGSGTEDEARLLEPLGRAFYKAPDDANKSRWADWLVKWRAALAAEEGGGSFDDAAARMRKANPKYVPREWMLAECYTQAEKDDYTLLHSLYQLFLDPYGEHPDLEEKYYQLTSTRDLRKGGIAKMS